MEQFPAAKETQPHGPADLRDQSTVFLMLEELGIAELQSDWLTAHDPGSEDCRAALEQAEEFLDDIAGLFSGAGSADRIEPNGWAGKAMADHIRAAMPAAVAQKAGLSAEAAAGLDDAALLRTALETFIESLRLLSAHQEAIVTEGGKPNPADYIQLMAAWSGFFSGEAERLELNAMYTPGQG